MKRIFYNSLPSQKYFAEKFLVHIDIQNFYLTLSLLILFHDIGDVVMLACNRKRQRRASCFFVLTNDILAAFVYIFTLCACPVEVDKNPASFLHYNRIFDGINLIMMQKAGKL